MYFLGNEFKFLTLQSMSPKIRWLPEKNQEPLGTDSELQLLT